MLTEHPYYPRKEDTVCGTAVMTGQNSHLLLTVVNLQFNNHTNTSESSLPLLWILHLEEAPEGGPQRAAQAADLLCVTDNRACKTSTP